MQSMHEAFARERMREAERQARQARQARLANHALRVQRWRRVEQLAARLRARHERAVELHASVF